jgi:hypothetical protein
VAALVGWPRSICGRKVYGRAYRVRALNARDRDFIPTLTATSLNATLSTEEALNPDEDFRYTEITKKHGVARSTLSRKHRGVSVTRAEAGLARRYLQPEQEAELVKYREDLTKRKLPPKREMVQNYASDITGHLVSKR